MFQSLRHGSIPKDQVEHQAVNKCEHQIGRTTLHWAVKRPWDLYTCIAEDIRTTYNPDLFLVPVPARSIYMNMCWGTLAKLRGCREIWISPASYLLANLQPRRYPQPSHSDVRPQKLTEFHSVGIATSINHHFNNWAIEKNSSSFTKTNHFKFRSKYFVAGFYCSQLLLPFCWVVHYRPLGRVYQATVSQVRDIFPGEVFADTLAYWRRFNRFVATKHISKSYI